MQLHVVYHVHWVQAIEGGTSDYIKHVHREVHQIILNICFDSASR